MIQTNLDKNMQSVLRSLKNTHADNMSLNQNSILVNEKNSFQKSYLNTKKNENEEINNPKTDLIQNSIQTHPLLINMKKTSKEKKPISSDDSLSSRRSNNVKYDQDQDFNNNNSKLINDNNKLVRIVKNPNSFKNSFECQNADASTSCYDDLKEREKYYLNDLCKNENQNRNQNNAKCSSKTFHHQQINNINSNKAGANNDKYFVNYVDDLVEDDLNLTTHCFSSKKAELNETCSKNNNNYTNQYNRNCSPRVKHPSQTELITEECDSNGNTMYNYCSSEVRKKFHRANRIFYNGFLNKQEKCANLPEYKSHAAELLHFLKSLWITNTMCDLNFVIGNQKFAAHRLGLAMFSRKYREEFQKQLQTKDSGIYTICLQNTTRFALGAILKYIYTAKIDINPANVEEILAAAKELGIDDLICMASDYLNSLSIGDVLDYMSNMFNKEGAELMFYELYCYMMTHLDKISRTPEYFQSGICVVKALLSDSHLAVMSELEVFEAAIRWINFDRSNRLKYVGDIMKNIRFTLMTPDEIVSKVESICYLRDNLDIYKMLYNAFKFHALNCLQSNLTSITQREECRNFELKGASVPNEFVDAVKELSEIAHKLKETRTYTTSNLISFRNSDECIQVKSKPVKTNNRCKTNNKNNNNSSSVVNSEELSLTNYPIRIKQINSSNNNITEECIDFNKESHFSDSQTVILDSSILKSKQDHFAKQDNQSVKIKTNKSNCNYGSNHPFLFSNQQNNYTTSKFNVLKNADNQQPETEETCKCNCCKKCSFNLYTSGQSSISSSERNSISDPYKINN